MREERKIEKSIGSSLGLLFIFSLFFSTVANADRPVSTPNSVIDHFINEASNGFRNRGSAGTRLNVPAGTENGVRRFAEPSFNSKDEEGVSENISKLAERISKGRRILIDELKKATTAETKEEAARALRKALGGDPEGKTLSPEFLATLVNNLKAATPETRDAAALALSKALSPDGEGKELTPRLLHDEVEKLKKGATAEQREPLVKNVLKAMGPDGIELFRRNGQIDTEAMAAALGLDRGKDADSLTALNNGLRNRDSLFVPTLASDTPKGSPIPLVSGPLQDGNAPGATPTPSPTPDGNNIKLDDAKNLDDGKNLFDPAGQQQDQIANVNQQKLDDVNDRLNRANQALQDLNNERGNNGKNGKNAKAKEEENKNETPPSSGSGGAGGSPPPPGEKPKPIETKEMPTLKGLTSFEAPKPGEDVKLDPNAIQAMLGNTGSGDGKDKWSGDKVQEILDAGMLNYKTSLQLLEAKVAAQEAMIKRTDGNFGNANRQVAAGIYQNAGAGANGAFAQRASKLTRSKGGPRVARTGNGGGGSTALAARSNGPGLQRSFVGRSSASQLRSDGRAIRAESAKNRR